MLHLNEGEAIKKKEKRRINELWTEYFNVITNTKDIKQRQYNGNQFESNNSTLHCFFMKFDQEGLIFFDCGYGLMSESSFKEGGTHIKPITKG